MDEHQEIIEGLLDGIEQLYLLAYAQRLLLTTLHGEAWEPLVALAQAEIAPDVSALFAPLRDAIAGAPDGSYPAGDWRRVVQRLVDSATAPEEPS
jgi:hypothetical protein